MSDNNTQAGQTQNAGVSTEEIKTDETNVNLDVEAKIEAARKEAEEKLKSEIAGLNRKNSELQNALKKKELEGKSEEEKTLALKAEKEQIEREIQELNRGRIIDRFLDSAELPLNFAKRIIGKDEAEIEADVKEFKEYINNLAQKIADKIIDDRLGKVKPNVGAAVNVKEISNSDFLAMSAKDRASFMASGGIIKAAVN